MGSEEHWQVSGDAYNAPCGSLSQGADMNRNSVCMINTRANCVRFLVVVFFGGFSQQLRQQVVNAGCSDMARFDSGKVNPE
jgi:hypothetical protein